jgi:hypothetical protein
VNAIAPFFTTTHLTSGISDAWLRAGLEVNTPDAVAEAIEAALLSRASGQGFLVSGSIPALLHCLFAAGCSGGNVTNTGARYLASIFANWRAQEWGSCLPG